MNFRSKRKDLEEQYDIRPCKIQLLSLPLFQPFSHYASRCKTMNIDSW